MKRFVKCNREGFIEMYVGCLTEDDMTLGNAEKELTKHFEDILSKKYSCDMDICIDPFSSISLVFVETVGYTRVHLQIQEGCYYYYKDIIEHIEDEVKFYGK